MPAILFPNPLPDETIFSLLCRFHLLAAHSSFRQYTLPLLGINGSRPSNEFPSFLPRLSEVSGIPLTNLVRQMTSIHYYQPFISDDEYNFTCQALKTGDTGSLQSHLGMVANRITPGKYLRFCPTCALKDNEKHGLAYWHKIHQLVGITVCPIHNCHLKEWKRSSVKLFLPWLGVVEDEGLSEECSFSRLISDEFMDTSTDITLAKIYSRYNHQINELGLQTACGQIRQKLFRSFLTDKLNTLSPLSQAFQYLALQTQKGQYPECLFYQSDSSHHPIKHFFLIYALFDNWSSFIDCDLTETSHTSLGPPRTETSMNWDKALDRVQRGESLRTVSSQYSTTVSTLKIKAQQVGIEVNSRPSKIFKSDERIIWRKLFIGTKTQAIAEGFGVSVGAIEKVLTKFPKLKILRKRIWYLADFRFHKKQLSTYLQNHCNAKRNHIKNAINASYMWLYKHEKEWLYQNLPPEIPRKDRYSRHK